MLANWLKNSYPDVKLRQVPNEQVRPVWNNTAFISPCFPDVWKRITTLTITNSLSPIIRKLIIVKSSLWRNYLKLEWQTIHSTPSTYYLLIPSKYLTSSWKAIFIWCLAFSYIIHLFMKPLPPLIPRQFSKGYYFICICSIKRH